MNGPTTLLKILVPVRKLELLPFGKKIQITFISCMAKIWQYIYFFIWVTMETKYKENTPHYNFYDI